MTPAALLRSVPPLLDAGRRPLIPGPFLRSEARVLGVPERRLNSRYFRTVFGGVVVDARIPDTVVVRARAALLVCPEGGVISHWTAARLWGEWCRTATGCTSLS